MRFRVRATGVAALTVGLLAAGTTVAVATPPAPAATVTVDRFLGEHRLDTGLTYGGTTVGGLSGIDYDPAGDTWYLISDDRSEHDPARWYTADLDFSGDLTFEGVTLTGTVPLRRPDGSTFPAGTVDPEAIRFDAERGTVLWTSEGERDLDAAGGPVLTDPSVRESHTDGTATGRLRLPDNLRMHTGDRGLRQNLALEGLTLTADGNHVVAAAEGPRFEDGPVPTPYVPSTTRLTVWDRAGGEPVAQYAYPLDRVPEVPVPPTETADNGVTAILALDQHRYLLVERAYSPGVGNSIRIYEVDTAAATNVLGVDALAGRSDYRPVTKTLVLDLGTSGLAHVDNIEGIALGPEGPDGTRALVLVSDNNFSDGQVTQLLAFAVRR